MAKTEQLRKWAESIYGLSPQIALQLADRRGARLQRNASGGKIGPVPRPDELLALFGPMGERELQELHTRSANCHARTVLIKEIVTERGLGSIQSLIKVDEQSRLRIERLVNEQTKVIVTTWHAGPTPAVWALLVRYNLRVFKLQNRIWKIQPLNWDIHIRDYDPGEGLRILRRARKHLREGNWMGVGFDHFDSKAPGRIYPCMGRAIDFPVGIAALSIMTGAVILPITARWDESRYRIHVEVQSPISPPPAGPDAGTEAEDALMRQLIQRMEEFVLRYPCQLNGRRVRTLLSFPSLNPARSSDTAAPVASRR